jgi:predicted transcriptional regulator
MQTHKVTAYLDAGVARDLAALAERRRLPAIRIVEAAVTSFLSPDSADQTEAAITRRLDRLTRTMDRLERDQQITGEALALFIRSWLTATPPVPDDLRDAAQAKGRERYGSFVETLARRLAKGTALSRELMRDLSRASIAPEDGEAGGR